MNITTIHNRIESFIKKYSTFYLNEFTKEIFNNNKSYDGVVKNLRRNIVTNHSRKNQYVYNYIVSSTINKMITYLGYSNIYFRERIDNMLSFEKKTFIEFIELTINPSIIENKKLTFKEYYYNSNYHNYKYQSDKLSL